MTYPINFESKIGFDKIRSLLHGSVLCPLGEARIDAMRFETDPDTIIRSLAECQEMMQVLVDSNNVLPTDAFVDLSESLQRIRIPGTYLEEEELLALRRSLGTIRALVKYFNPGEEEGRQVYPHLQNLSLGVSVPADLLKEIDQVITPTGEIKDHASPKLAEIRRQLRTTLGSISGLLNSILRHAQSDGWVEKEVSPTLRDGRLVIPISPAFKRKIKGIVHDESATGKTVYVEPSEVVDANNRIRELEGEERQEIIRILSALTEIIRPRLPEIMAAYDFMGAIDFIRAKAKLALRIEATAPHIDATKHITDWVEARHPLLYLRYKAENKATEVVPLDITLGTAGQRIVLISGPNAGGKSVCLETLGLLQYMLQCGLPIPVKETSHCTIYDHIFIDIGDEQSIDNDLSTYSSHLTNMKFFLRHASPHTLILIDEFGSGTEPQIGGAIAQAILAQLNKAQLHGVITTHFQNLKHFADQTQGITNGAMLYDRHEMRPLFKLEVGRPGSSFAIEIAHKIGLPQSVITEAKNIVGEDYVNMDKYLLEIARDKRYWEQKRQRIHQQEKALDELATQLQEQTADLKSKRQSLIKDAKEEALQMIRESNARIERTIREIKEAQAEKEATRNIRQKLKDFAGEIENQDLKGVKELKDNTTLQAIRRRTGKKKTPQEKPSAAEETPTFNVGDTVRMKGQSTPGEIISIGKKDCVVAFGMLKSTVALTRLEPVSRRQLKKEKLQQNLTGGIKSAVVSDEIRERRLHFKSEIDVRGMRADEALQAVTYFIDDAILLSVGQVRILHGTGTGVLRTVIRQYLATVPGITHFHDEHVQFGGAGITVVELD